MNHLKIALYSNSVLLADQIGAFTIFVEANKIVDIQAGKVEKTAYILQDYGDAVIMPGIIDPHVHINEPGRTEWEGFDTGCTAAAAGGVTTLVDMPLNASPVTISVDALHLKLNAVGSQKHVHCGFYGGIVPGNTEHLKDLAAAGVLGFKAFLTHSGIDEFPNADIATLKAAYETLKNTQLPILAHCELSSGDYAADLRARPTDYVAYLASRPKKWENDAVELMIDLARFYQHPTHIVHLSSADPLPAIRAAKSDNVPLTVETCPHYLYFDAESIPNADTRYKCAPPIREKANNDLLWQAVLDGTIDFLGSDHSPAPPTIKALDSGDLSKAWGGISAIQYSLPAIWTKGQSYGLKLEHVRRVFCENSARFIGQAACKGRLSIGYDADMVVWHPEAEFKVEKQSIQARHKVSPYENESMKGVVLATYVGGEKVFEKEGLVQRNKGNLIIH